MDAVLNVGTIGSGGALLLNRWLFRFATGVRLSQLTRLFRLCFGEFADPSNANPFDVIAAPADHHRAA